jgi:hypothetical protein
MSWALVQDSLVREERRIRSVKKSKSVTLLSLGLLAVAQLAGCTATNPLPSKLSNPSISRQLSGPNVPSLPITTQATATLKSKPDHVVTCYQGTITGSWKLLTVVDNWNKNGKNLLFPVGISECAFGNRECRETDICVATVTISLTDKDDGNWGLTQGRFSPWEYITLNTQTPITAQQHTLCHELGHALRLEHHPGRSCMNPDDTVPIPSGSDLDDVAKAVANLTG